MNTAENILTFNTADDILKIDTSAVLELKKPIKILPVYSDKSPYLKEVVLEYSGVLPNPEISHLIKQMKATKCEYKGIGLAANQCGYRIRAFIIGIEDDDVVCINPRVLDQSKEMIKGKEGCLSFPGLFCNIKRPAWIDVEFFDENGIKHSKRYEGLTARCFMHELDHLNGTTIVDHLGKLSLRLAIKRQEKLLKKLKKG